MSDEERAAEKAEQLAKMKEEEEKARVRRAMRDSMKSKRSSALRKVSTQSRIKIGLEMLSDELAERRAAEEEARDLGAAWGWGGGGTAEPYSDDDDDAGGPAS